MDSETARLGQHAKQLVNDPNNAQVLNMIEQQLTQSWKNAQTTEDREEIWYTLKGHQRFIETLLTLEDNYDYELSQEGGL